MATFVRVFQRMIGRGFTEDIDDEDFDNVNVTDHKDARQSNTKCSDQDYQFECAYLSLGYSGLPKDKCGENIIFIVDSSSRMSSSIQFKRNNAENIQKPKIELEQTTLLDLIDQIWITQPNCEIGMITFDDELKVHTANGSRWVDKQDLKDNLKLMEIGRDCSKKMFTSKKDVFLKQTIQMLTAEGELKMYPALYVALGMANTSQIIVFTDNILKYLLSDFDNEDDHTFEDIASLAQSKQISVSMISFHQCFLEETDICPEYDVKDCKCTTVTDIFNTLVRNTSERNLSDDNFTDQISKHPNHKSIKHRDLATILENSILKECSLNSSSSALVMPDRYRDKNNSGNIKAYFFWNFLEYLQPLNSTNALEQKEHNESLSDKEGVNNISDMDVANLIHSTLDDYTARLEQKLYNDQLNQTEKLREVELTIQETVKEAQKLDEKILAVKKFTQERIEVSCNFIKDEIQSTITDLKLSSKEDQENFARDIHEKFNIQEQKNQSIDAKLKSIEQQGVNIFDRLGMVCSVLSETSSHQMPNTQFGSTLIDPSRDGDGATNVLKVDIVAKVTEKPKTIMPEKCSKTCENEKCQAMFSHLDTCESHEQGYKWTCSFCCTVNLTDNLLIFSPDDCEVCYVYTAEEETSVLDEYKIIFVIDISGSMSEKCTNSDVTRLEAVQTAVCKKIEELIKKDPKRRVGLVTFHTTVTVYGTDQAYGISTNMDNIDFLLGEGRSNSDIKPLETKGGDLVSIMRSTKPDSRTALGPAILVALGLTSNSRGSKIIICTDGMANEGVGNLDHAEAEFFYHQVIQLAKQEAVTISINSFDDCQLSALEVMTRETGGMVRRISPTDLLIHIAEDVNRKVIATDAELKIVVPQEMFVSEAGSNDESQSTMTIKVGNVLDCNSQISSFKFGFRENAVINTNWHESETGHYCVPFQVTTIYRDNEGKNLKRVYSVNKKIAKNSEEAKMFTNPEAVVTNKVQTFAKSLLQQKQSGNITSDVEEIILKVTELKNMRLKPEIVKKIGTFILVLNKIKSDGLTDELSVHLSKLASIS